MCLQGFCFAENPGYRQHFRRDFISRKTFIKYLQLLAAIVEGKVKELLSDKFAVDFDGWAGGGTHYVAVFATFPSDNPNRYEKLLVGVSPMENGTSKNVQNHYELIISVLSVFGKQLKKSLY